MPDVLSDPGTWHSMGAQIELLVMVSLRANGMPGWSEFVARNSGAAARLLHHELAAWKDGNLTITPKGLAAVETVKAALCVRAKEEPCL